MSSANSQNPPALTVPVVLQVDAACDRFEEAWQAGRPPPLEEVLNSVAESVRPTLLRQLLLLEWDYRRRHGKPLDVANDMTRFPEYAALIEDAVREHAAETEAAPPGPPSRDWKDLGYVIVSQLGRGGVGTVYLARQTAADRLVALKVLQDGPATDPAVLERFRREATTLARLQHPNIVPVFEVGEYEGRPFYSMEYCPGGSLADHLRRKPLPPHQAATLLETLARAAHAAHRAGIVHRDLKPGNILIAGCGMRNAELRTEERGEPRSSNPHSAFRIPQSTVPKIADFGMAKKQDAAAQTQTGAVMGTPSYMAPEQARGESKAAGATVDVYALGAVLYECLTGRPPFLGTTPVETVLQVISNEIVPPGRLQPKLSRDLETICLKCLHKEPQRRYPDAAALAEDLRRFQSGEPILARPAGVWERTRKWVRRRPAAAALIGIMVLSSVGGMALAGWALAERAAALTAREKAEEQRRRAERQAALNLYEKALFHCERDGAARGTLWLARSLKEAVDVEERDLEALIRKQLGLWSRDIHPLGQVLAHREQIQSVAFSPDGKTVLTGSADATAQLWEAATGARVGAPLKHKGWVMAVALSPDGKTVLTGSADKTARLWDAASGKPLCPPLVHRDEVRAAAFAPDGQTALTASNDQTARLWDAPSGRPGPVLPHTGPVRAVAFSPDGKTVLTGGNDQTARLWEVATGKPLSVFPHGANVRTVAFSPDGRTVATGGEDHKAQIWEAPTGKRRGSSLEHQGAVTTVALSPDGKTLLTCGQHEAFLWEVATGKRLVPPLQHFDEVLAAAFSPDGRVVATGSADQTARLWDAGTGRPLGPPLQHQDYVGAVAFGPDGRRVLTGSCDKTARVWEIAGKPLDRTLTHDGELQALAFSPDGEMIVTGSCDNHARLWRTATGERLLKLERRVWVQAVAFSPDGRTVVTGGVEPTVCVWAVDTGKLERELPHPSRVRSVNFSPDGKLIVTGCEDGKARQWDAATGRLRDTVLDHKGRVQSAAYSPDGKTILTAGGGPRARLWNAVTGEPLGKPLEHQRDIWGAAFSPDGKTVLAVGVDTARLWDVATGEPLGSPIQNQRGIWAGAFSPDGKTLLVAAGDNTARLLDVATRQLLGPPLQHTDFIYTVAFSPNGKLILTGSRDKTARLREVTPPVEGDPERIILWAQVLTGMELDEQGNTRVLAADTWNERKQKLAALGGPVP